MRTPDQHPTLQRRRFLQHAGTLLGLAATGLLAACGGAASTAVTTTSAAPQATTASRAAPATRSVTTANAAASHATAASTASSQPTAAAAATGSAATGHLAVWMWWADPVDSVKQMAASYSAAHPGVAIDVLAPSDYWTKLESAIAGAVGPDLFFMNNVNYWAWATKGLLADLDARIAQDAPVQADLKQFWQDAITFYTFQGKHYGLPYMYTTIVLYYNADLLTAAQVPDLAGRQASYTWDNNREDALKLTKRTGDQTSAWGMYSTQGLESGWLNWVRANGGDYLSADATACVIDSPAAAAAWTYLTDLNLKDRVSPDAAALKQGDLFMAGTLAMTPGGSWLMKTYNQKVKSFTYNIVPIPLSPTTHKAGGTTNIVGLTLNKAGKQQDATWGFVGHMVTKDSMDLLARNDVLAPVRNDSAQLYYDPKLGPANRTAAFDMLQWTTPLPTAVNATYAEITKPSSDLQGKIFGGQMTVQDGLKQMADLVNAVLHKS